MTAAASDEVPLAPPRSGRSGRGNLRSRSASFAVVRALPRYGEKTPPGLRQAAGTSAHLQHVRELGTVKAVELGDALRR